MLGRHGRGFTRALMTGPARLLARAGVTPNQLTVTGTVISSATALILIPAGWLLTALAALVFTVLADSLDGTLARLTGRESTFGAFLDSTLDRVTDGAIFGALALWAAWHAPGIWGRAVMVSAITTLIFGSAVPYARAKAESLGLRADVGMAERSDRLVVAGIGVLLVGLGLPVWILAAALIYLTIASLITVWQRLLIVYRALEKQ